jgi:histone acetyltransferase (RNA polymerase elongator complex component)
MKKPRKRIIPLFIPFFGCKSQCVFCDQRMLTGIGNTAPTSEDIWNILEKALALQPSGQKVEAAFYGGSFTALPLRQQEELLAPAQHFLRRGILTGIRLSTRPDAIEEEEARWLKTQGVSCVELGAQSLCSSVLNAAKRGYQFSCVEKAVTVLRNVGLTVGVQLMPGLPGETRPLWQKTLQRLWKLAPDFIRLYPTVVLEGTELAVAYANGAYKPLALAEAVERTAWALDGCRQRGIDVIRMGLQDSEELHSAKLLAGPYHPAFGELVWSFLVRQQVLHGLEQLSSSACRLFYHPQDASKVRGQKNENLRCWERAGLGDVSLQADASVCPGSLQLEAVQGQEKLHLGMIGRLYC